MIYGAGMLELGITFDFAQLVMDNEIFAMIKKAIGGIAVTDEAMAVDIIKQVGAAGEFVSHEHTFKHFKKEQSRTKLIDRRMRDAWLADGSKDFTERAYEEANFILNNHKPEPLADDVAKTIRSIIEEAEEEYAVNKKGSSPKELS